MLTYTFDNSQTQPLYEQLYEKIRDDVLSGILQSGDKLPSKRAFAQQLNISTITIENAYQQLVTEGYLEARPRSGYYVAEFSVLPHRNRILTGNEKTSEKATGKVRGSSQLRTETEKTKWFADFTSNQNDPESFPFSIWARLSREVLSTMQDELMTNPPGEGVLILREAIASYLRDFRGTNVTAEQVIIGAGSEYLYGRLIRLLGYDKIYATEDPGYRTMYETCNAYRVKCLGIHLDRKGLRADELTESGADVVHVTPSHHFPTGITMPVTRRGQLIDWANAKDGRYIIEDDFDSELRINGRILPPLSDIDTEGKVIYMNTFTKSLSSTIRISYMVLPPELAKRYREEMAHAACPVPTFEQYTLALFLSRGYFEKHINRMRNTSRKRRDLLLRTIDHSKLKNIVHIAEENAGLHFLMSMDLPVSGTEFVAALKKRGLRMMSMKEYTGLEDILKQTQIRDPGTTFIVNYSSIPEDRIEEAVRRMEECIELK